jgi:hypothetical protein
MGIRYCQRFDLADFGLIIRVGRPPGLLVLNVSSAKFIKRFRVDGVFVSRQGGAMKILEHPNTLLFFIATTLIAVSAIGTWCLL